MRSNAQTQPPSPNTAVPTTTAPATPLGVRARILYAKKEKMRLRRKPTKSWRRFMGLEKVVWPFHFWEARLSKGRGQIDGHGLKPLPDGIVIEGILVDQRLIVGGYDVNT